MGFDDVAILNAVGLSLSLQAVFTRARVELAALVLQVVHELVNHKARGKGRFIIAVLLVDVDDVVVVVPASNAAIAATAGTFYEEAVGFELNGGRNLGGRITGEV